MTLELVCRAPSSSYEAVRVFDLAPDGASDFDEISAAAHALPRGGLLSDDNVNGSVNNDDDPAVEGASNALISSIVPIMLGKGYPEQPIFHWVLIGIIRLM